MYVIIMVISTIVVPVEAMEYNEVLVKSSDNKECRLSQWKIESSRLLHTKQELQIFKGKHSGALLAPIVLKTICQKKIQLFSGALDALYFPYYLKKLTPDEKNLLVSAVGPQELDSSYVICQFLNAYFSQYFIKKNIIPCLSTTVIGHYLQGLVIADNCKHKNFVYTKTETDMRDLACNDDGSYYNLPKILLPNPNFSGFTFPVVEPISAPLVDEFEAPWLLNKITKNIQGKVFILTPMEPTNYDDCIKQMFLKENKKILWVKRHENDKGLQKVIEHINAIEYSAFSSDGKFLATGSVGEPGELLLTNLAINNNMFTRPDILLTGHSGSIDCICFNKQSTIVAAASKKNIYLWDVQKYSVLATLEYPEGKTHIMQFCDNDNKLITVSFDETVGSSIIRLWVIADLAKIDIKLRDTYRNSYIHSVALTPLEDKIIIKTSQRAIIFDMLLEKSIMDTKVINNPVINIFSRVEAVLMPYQSIFVTTARNDCHQCSVTLWDMNSQKRIITLLENQEHLCGIGVDSSGRYVIAAALFPCDTVKIALYDDNAADCLEWIKNQANLLQRYLLLRLYDAYKHNDMVKLHPNSPEYRILQDLPTAPCGVKEMVEKYLLK